ncbi:cellular tumor antigen p53 isoform X2 [Daktulosphaira vitifoliae]|uniref:cellular tumor antigen p53 isoform X2 n=1 Tax=Daktulosphaira vitifoliae TaxID=58002 RepID=UPI0021A9D31B|nr:cellular tumor antigen p53 isoform X2 [Daktulosphaira vitifoliae]
MMDNTKLPGLAEIQLPNYNPDIFNFDPNVEQLNILNDFNGYNDVMINQSEVSDFCFTMPMENGRIVDLNLPPTPEKDQENRETCTAGSVKSSPTGIIPCQDEFGGNFNFEVLLDSSSQAYRQKWSYDYDQSFNCQPFFVRAMPMYSSADWLKEPVERCLQHLSPIDQINKDFHHLKHVIRCDNDNTAYHIDEKSNRKSVVTLLRQPEIGADTSKLSYRFVCKTSCAGGMQRRPIIVIFTLEDQIGQVLGRRVLPVKICSCPKRDMDREENETKLKKNTVFRRTKRCMTTHTERHHHHHHRHDNNPLPPKMIKLESTDITESESDCVQEKNFTLPINYVTNCKKNYKAILEGLYTSIVGVSSLHNINDTQTILEDLKFRLNNLE